MKINCFFITRSSSNIEAVDGKLVRQQINQLSSLIDGTTVYGATKQHAEAVKDHDKMHLMFADMGPMGQYLPTTNMIKKKNSAFSSLTNAFQLSSAFNEHNHLSFFAGDTRVSENQVLTYFHTMFMRFHNLMTDHIIAAGHEDASDPDFVFNEARLLNIAMMQHIVYSEQLPSLLGRKAYDSIPW